MASSITLPWPQLGIGINPAAWGLDGLPTRFWVTGYDGGPVTASQHVHEDRSSGPPGCPGGPPADMDVTVRASVTSFEWDFGDGLATSHLATGSLGQAYPLVSDVQHQYEYTSAGLPSGFPVTLVAHFVVAYQVDSGAWQSLLRIDRTSTRGYPVQAAVPVLVNHAAPTPQERSAP